jgi:molybdopterin-guanine dinucleotide biosynthesis protein B
MKPVDLVLVEGFHAEVPACLEVWRSTTGKEPLFAKTTHIQAVATDSVPLQNPEGGKVFFSLNETQSIFDYIQKNLFSWEIT